MTTIDGQYIPSPTPKPHPRVKPEAANYAERNRGNMERWFDYSGNDDYESPRPAGRNVSNEGKKNAETNQGTMSSIMGGYADPPVQRQIHPRGVKGEGAEIAQQNKGGAMKDLIDNYGNLSVSAPPGHKVHGDAAEENAQRNVGVVDKLMNNYGNLTPESQPPQKVGFGGDVVASKHTGAGMGPLLRMEGELSPAEVKAGRLHQQSEGPGWDEDPPAVRTRPEAEAIADRQTADEMGNVLAGEVTPPNGREAKVLPHMQVSQTPKYTSPVRGRSDMHKNQSSELSAIMHGETHVKSTPSKKQNRMMMKSEDW